VSRVLAVTPLALPRLRALRLSLDSVLLLAVILLALGLGLPNLASSPPLNYDEGYDLQAPHNLVHRGFYGTQDLDWRIPFDFNITTGPAVTLPVAGSFLLFGEGTEQARGVVVLYSALAVAALYLLARRMLNPGFSLFAATLFAVSLYPYNRLALGEVPTLFWLFLGGWLWLRTVGGRQRRSMLGVAGLCFGMAALCKLSSAPIAGLTVFLTWLAGGAYRDRKGWESLLLPAAAAALPLAAWWGLHIALLGLDGTLQQAGVMGSYRDQMLDLSPEHLGTNLARLGQSLPPGLGPWLAAGFILAAVRVIAARKQDLNQVFALALFCSASAFFFVSIGWDRYAFWAGATGTLLVAQLAPWFSRVAASVTDGDLSTARAALAPAIVVAAFLGYPLFQGVQLPAAGSADAVDAASYLDDQLNEGETAGTAEWELDFLTGRTFRHPPTYLATATKETIEAGFDWNWPGMEWVVIGPVGRALGAEVLLARNPRFIERHVAGEYHVYQRLTGAPPAWMWSRDGATSAPPLAYGTRAGQTFVSPYDSIQEVRLLLSGEGRINNTPVLLRLFEHAGDAVPIAEAELEGRRLTENRWYRIPINASVVPGRPYYLEVTGAGSAGGPAVTPWYNLNVNYSQGHWYLNGEEQEGDLYFAVIGHRPKSERLSTG
jgi:4-amino-4-deoxy-L-arabinose transferase-like glycosyltransferase